MQVDWFTIVAQALNFLVLLWLMKRFLYRPILNAIDEREKRIADQIASANDRDAEAQKKRDEYEEKNELIDRERTALMDAARSEAETEKLKLLDEAREAAEDVTAKRRKALQDEELALRADIGRRTREEVFALAREALAALAGTRVEERMVELFNDHLRSTKDEEAQTLRSVLTSSADAVLVRTGLDLKDQQKTTIEDSIRTLLGADTGILFETAPELISGIELNANGHKVAWSIDGFLSSLEESGMHANGA